MTLPPCPSTIVLQTEQEEEQAATDGLDVLDYRVAKRLLLRFEYRRHHQPEEVGHHGQQCPHTIHPEHYHRRPHQIKHPPRVGHAPASAVPDPCLEGGGERRTLESYGFVVAFVHPLRPSPLLSSHRLPLLHGLRRKPLPPHQ